MDLHLLNGLIALCLVLVSKVQGYLNNQIHHYNETSADYLVANYSHHINKENRHDNKFEDDVFRYYRSEIRREPRFISFETRDDNIEVELDFAIPFLSIPVKRALSGGVGNTVQSMLRGVPFANVNLGAVILAGFVAIGGAILGGLTRAFKGDGFGAPIDLFIQKKKQQKYYQDIAFDILENVDKALIKYDFDSTACTQRIVCWYIKESIANMMENKASQMDKIINGIISADWAVQMISGTAIEDAINVGKRGQSCEHTYSNCKLNSKNIDKFVRNLVKNSK